MHLEITTEVQMPKSLSLFIVVALVVAGSLIYYHWRPGEGVEVTNPPNLTNTTWEVRPDTKTGGAFFDLVIDRGNPATHELVVTARTPDWTQEFEKVNGTYIGLHLQFQLGDGARVAVFSADLKTKTKMEGSMSDGKGGVVRFTASRKMLR
jgi:hypothetical protein